jgi:hypothetical protein
LKDILVALFKTLLIVAGVSIPIALWVFIFSLCIGEDGYIHEWGMLFVFLSIFSFGFGLILHFIIHHVNSESHKWCVFCLSGKFLDRLLQD